MKKNLLFSFLATGLSLAIFLLGLQGVFSFYFYWAENNNKDIPKIVQDSPVVQKLFVDKHYKKLMGLISKEHEKFETIWDFSDTVFLSKSIFLPRKKLFENLLKSGNLSF